MEELKKTVCSEVDAWRDRLVATSRKINAHPELGFEEVKASKWLVELLAEAGFNVRLGEAGMDTAFWAEYRGPGSGKTVTFLAEYDALPEIGHACGHNIIGTSNVGAAIALKVLLERGEVDGTVRVYGTPAEEGGGGKIPFVEQGYFDDVDAVLSMHPANDAGGNSVGSGCLAVDHLVFRFRGRAAHAAGSPHEGINALNALIATFNNIDALRQHVKSDVRIHGIITRGGVRPNIVPERAEGEFYVRAAEREYLDSITEKVIKCAEAGALATGAELEIDHGVPYDNMISNRPLGEALVENMLALGHPTTYTDHVGSHSTDLGNVSHVVPTASLSVAIAPADVPVHNAQFAAYAGGERGDWGVVVAAKALAMTGVDVLANAVQV